MPHYNESLGAFYLALPGVFTSVASILRNGKIDHDAGVFGVFCRELVPLYAETFAAPSGGERDLFLL